ncbi:MAG: phage holin family protein [Bacilli bacterium]
MNLEILASYIIPMVTADCLIIGYLIKKSLDFIPNKYIPLILAIFGAIINCILNSSIDVNLVACGAFSGLASTGLHQAFTKIIEREEV